MKKLFSLFAIAALLCVGCGKEYDDSALNNRVGNLENRVAKLEELCKQMNTNISSLQTLVNALQNNDYITGVTPVTSGGKTVGYTITFAKSPSITIYHGQDGKDGINGTNGKDGQNGTNGKDGTTPVISVAKYNGEYYWMVNGRWLTDATGNMIKASGTNGKDGINGTNGKDGQNGTNGKDGITPQLKIETGYWFISYDNGSSWSELGKAVGDDGQNGTDGDSMFKEVREDDNNVYFELSGGTTITIPKSGNESQFAIKFDSTDIAIPDAGETVAVGYTITAATENTVVKAFAQDGWSATVVPTSVSSGSIKITAPDPFTAGEILVFANDGSYRTLMVTLRCTQKEKEILIIQADNTFDVSAGEETCQVKLQTNADYSVNIPDDARSWLSVAETRAMRDETLTFTIQPNEAITSRFATVTLNGSNGAVLQSIIFRQSGKAMEGMLEIHVETAGTLQQLLASYNKSTIKAMKVTGVMNDKDFLQIYHEMPDLRDLDISEVNITSLPTRSFYQSKNVENLILPKTLTTIPAEVFCESAIKNITLYDNITAIGSSAFKNCKGLTNINIPASVETIGESAFEDCTRLTNISIPEGVKTIENSAFLKCISLDNISIPASVETIGKSAFEDCTGLTNISISEGVKTIGSSAFMACSGLNNISIPASVETIGSSAFAGCTALSVVTFADGCALTALNDYTFYDCQLTSIRIPAKVATIGMPFSGCNVLQSVTFEPNSELTKIVNANFGSLPALQSIEIPANVETIGLSAFKNRTQLSNVTFESGSKLKIIDGELNISENTKSPYSLTVNTYGAFEGCLSLTKIDIPAQVTTIAAGAFYNTGLYVIKIPASVETIAEFAFQGSNLYSITFEKNSKLKTIGGGGSSRDYGAFCGCPLSEITIPASVESIGKTAFKNCKNLKIVKFEKGSKLATIEGGGSANTISYYGENYYWGTFYNCTALKEIEIPANVEIIKATAFKGCSSLTSVTFEPNSKLKTIYCQDYGPGSRRDFGAFSNCGSLSSIEFPANLETIDEFAFYNCTNLQEINFQKGSLLKTIGYRAFSFCTTMHYFYATNCTALKKIDSYAFDGANQIWYFEIGAPIPPTCVAVFGNIDPKSILKVPAGTVSVYRTATGWKNFSSISEIGK